MFQGNKFGRIRNKRYELNGTSGRSIGRGKNDRS